MIKIVKAVLHLIESAFRSANLSGPNSRERVKEKVVVVLNGREVKQ
jgi:hypothetical protein